MFVRIIILLHSYVSVCICRNVGLCLVCSSSAMLVAMPILEESPFAIQSPSVNKLDTVMQFWSVSFSVRYVCVCMYARARGVSVCQCVCMYARARGVSVCQCVCMYVCVRVGGVCLSVCMCVCMYARARGVSVSVCVCMCACGVCVCQCVCVYARARGVSVCQCVCVCARAGCVCVCMRACVCGGVGGWGGAFAWGWVKRATDVFWRGVGCWGRGVGQVQGVHARPADSQLKCTSEMLIVHPVSLCLSVC